jgi:hypothetical protein
MKIAHRYKTPGKSLACPLILIGIFMLMVNFALVDAKDRKDAVAIPACSLIGTGISLYAMRVQEENKVKATTERALELQ